MRHIRMANNKDKAAILNLYHSLIGTPGCTWSMEYPTMFEIENDIASCSLYCMFDESDNIIAVASAGKSDELNHLLWNEKIRNPCDLARVGVKRSMHHQGLGYSIVEFMITDLKKRGFDGIRMLVSRTNPSALALYEKLNFCRCGETRMYDIDFYCYEMVLEDQVTEKEKLILDLQGIKENNYVVTDRKEIFRCVGLMLEHIGDPDPDLRDELIYTTFSEWICEKEYFNDADLLHMLDILLDKNHLFYHIGNDRDDTVFTRTFSILVIVLVLIQHRKKPILDADKFLAVKNAILKYYEDEKDLRGYIDKFGWAHGAAHGSDALDELVQCKECDALILQEILDSIKKVLYNDRYVLFDEEDERIARVVFRMIKLHTPSFPLLGNWIGGLGQCCEWERTRGQFIARVNSKNFVRCLYFELVHHQVPAPAILSTLLDTEAKLNRFVKTN